MKKITGCTQLIALLGSPVSHSISPRMHNEAFRELGLNYIYKALETNAEQMAATVDHLRKSNARGFNVTMPGKTIVASLCDRLSPAAEISGSVNTVVIENGTLIGHTTDGIGYFRALEEYGYHMTNKKMTLLGTGGAATSIFVQAALDKMSEISIFNRPGKSFDHAKGIIGQLRERTSCKINLYDINDIAKLKQEIYDSSLLTNATSVGMAPNIECSLIEDTSFFHKDLLVSDVIYNPRETRFLKLAKEAGCQTSNGLYMLLYQGAEAFKLWTGQEMPIELIKEKYFSE